MASGKYLKSTEHRANLSKARIGMKFSDEHRRKLSESHKGKKPIIPKDIYKIISQKNTGKKRSEETKAKLRISRAKQIMKPRTEEFRRKLSEDRKGAKWYTWKGGLTPINLAIRNQVEYKLWRESIFKRDNYTCVFCKVKGGTLNADHIKPFAYYPELRFAIDNGRTLCVPCHKTTATYGGKCKK